jgi:hypothetical protein
VSTDVDGSPPSMAGEARLPADPLPEPPVPTARGPSPPGPAPPSPSPRAAASQAEPAAHDDEPDTAAVELHQQLRRTADENRKNRTGGRHARRDGRDAPPPVDYVPRHAMSTPGPGTRPPLGADRLPSLPPATVAALGLAAPEPPPAVAPPPDLLDEPSHAPPSSPPKRVRVVLAERKRPIHPVGGAVHFHELDDVGELLSSNLIKSQLGLALRYGGIAIIVLVLLPVLFAAVPALDQLEVLGLRLPWLVLGFLCYPFLLGLGWRYARATERLELSFTDHIRD